MEIVSKSFFTYLDLTMDHFKISLEVREKFLVWSAEFFEITDDHRKKWSKVGKGIDYYTFKHWISKDNRFESSTTILPYKSFKIDSHYHSLESVFDKMCENSYEEKLQFYQALSLLALVDRKYLTYRVEFLNWTALSLDLEDDDCTIIREHVVEEFNLSFDIENLKQNEKEDIFLSGVKMAYLSGDIIDHNEEKLLNNLLEKIGGEFSHLEDKYYMNYFTSSFSKNEHHSRLAIHKIGAVLLSIIGCDDSIDKREGSWFKENLSGLDNALLSELLSSSIVNIIDGMTNEDKLLCYILGLEVSLLDEVIHKNEAYWLNYIFDSLDKNFKMERDLSLVFIESVGRNHKYIFKNLGFFTRVSSFFSSSIEKHWASWEYLCGILNTNTDNNKFSNIFLKDKYSLVDNEQTQELIYLSYALTCELSSSNLLRGLSKRISQNISKDIDARYGEMLLCEILKISFLDHEIDSLEDDYLRELQYRFNITEKDLHRVVFITAFLIGRKIELSPRVNYSYL
ncbi:hypothetical protein [Halobacteriovorax sp.]|uniref:hypothetical protein n=1 Tax=Halobacteriovorax sp. TaxID=2020862 RepID=UPI0035695ED0